MGPENKDLSITCNGCEVCCTKYPFKPWKNIISALNCPNPEMEAELFKKVAAHTGNSNEEGDGEGMENECVDFGLEQYGGVESQRRIHRNHAHH